MCLTTLKSNIKQNRIQSLDETCKESSVYFISDYFCRLSRGLFPIVWSHRFLSQSDYLIFNTVLVYETRVGKEEYLRH